MSSSHICFCPFIKTEFVGAGTEAWQIKLLFVVSEFYIGVSILVQTVLLPVYSL